MIVLNEVSLYSNGEYISSTRASEKRKTKFTRKQNRTSFDKTGNFKHQGKNPYLNFVIIPTKKLLDDYERNKLLNFDT